MLCALSGFRTALSPPVVHAASPVVFARQSVPKGVKFVQASTQYSQALAQFNARDYRGAISSLDAVRAERWVDADGRAYLDRQRAICEQRLNGSFTTKSQRHEERLRTADCGPRALEIVCGSMGVKASVGELSKAAGTTSAGTTMAGLAKAAQSVGLKAEGVQMDRTALSQLGTVAIVFTDSDHYIAVLGVDGEQATVHDPNKPAEEQMSISELLRRSGGMLLTIRR